MRYKAFEEAHRIAEEELATLKSVLDARNTYIVCSNCSGTGVTHKHIRNSLGTYGRACRLCDGEGKYKMQVGDTCRLKSGGPVMTLLADTVSPPVVRVGWFNTIGNSSEFKDAFVPITCLEPCSPRGEPNK